MKYKINGIVLAWLWGDEKNHEKYTVDEHGRCFYEGKHCADIISESVTLSGIEYKFKLKNPIQSVRTKEFKINLGV